MEFLTCTQATIRYGETSKGGNEERDRRLQVVKLLTALSYCVGGSLACSVFQLSSQHQINATATTTITIPRYDNSQVRHTWYVRHTYVRHKGYVRIYICSQVRHKYVTINKCLAPGTAFLCLPSYFFLILSFVIPVWLPYLVRVPSFVQY